MTKTISIEQQDLGIMGTGTKMFRSGWAHSSGKVFIGSYGPAPANIWQYDPDSAELTHIGAPGEYQLDCMVEAPNGKIYIGTAYSALVYELDPTTGAIRDLGTPPVDSTPWIFTMICTRDGEIYGAKGVGLFHLDWRTGKMTSCGTVPGEHSVPGHTSAPIVRTLEERPDGLLWGDTNRWVFTFDPRTRQITPVADIVEVDDACYAVVHGLGSAPVNDLYFQIYPRFSGKTPRTRFHVCRAATGAIEPLELDGLEGYWWLNGWWMDGQEPRLLITHQAPGATASSIAIVDIDKQEVVDRWTVESTDLPPLKVSGPGLWFMSTARGTLYTVDLPAKRLEPLATNPVPVECRCLAISSSEVLATDTYDCGFVFTRPVDSENFRDHGRVWQDDHRCNHGPSAFAGPADEYFLANHGEEQVVRLWATHLPSNRHWPIGEPAIQLLRAGDGAAWGTQGPNPPALDFDPAKCWTPAWHARPGVLFRWSPAEEAVETFPELGPIGPIAESPHQPGRLLLCNDRALQVWDAGTLSVLSEQSLASPVLALAADGKRGQVYAVLKNGTVCRCREGAEGQLSVAPRGAGFGSPDRGCFVLPCSGLLVGLGNDGTVWTYDPHSDAVRETRGPVPLPAGPAVSPARDAWYFADRNVVEYSLGQGQGCIPFRVVSCGENR